MSGRGVRDSGSADPARERLPARIDGAAEALPGVIRIATSVGVRSGVWMLGSGLRSGRLLARSLTDPQVAGELVETVATDVAEATRVVSEVARSIAAGVPPRKAVMDAGASLAGVVVSSDRTRSPDEQEPDAGRDQERAVRRPPPRREVEPSLRDRGEALLQRSRDVWSDEEPHPAYARILEDLAPDEARILLLLLQGGPQPSVDVRTGGPLGMVSSSLIAPGLTMIGARAGCRYVEEVPAYLNNLERLGLIWFSREQVKDPTEYQVVEAQPDVEEAMRTARFTKVVRRSIHLTPFGTDFCRTCLVDPEKLADLPPHLDPGFPGAPEAGSSGQ